jgi:hypothetical protein
MKRQPLGRGLIGPVLACLAVVSFGADAPTAEAPGAPVTYRATVMVLNAPQTGIVRLRMMIDRWSTDEEKKGLLAALKSGGTRGVVAAMDGMQAGFLQIDDNLRWPIRIASTWKTDKGQKVRLATNRPIDYREILKGARTADYPIGIVEFILPAEGRGEGTLFAATQAGFDDQGRIEVRSLPTNTGAQKMANVEIEK